MTKTCDICNKTYSTIYSLKRHLKTKKHKNNMNNLKCIVPLEIENIILDYKNQLEINEKYNNCMKEIKNNNKKIASYRSTEYGCYEYRELCDFYNFNGYGGLDNNGELIYIESTDKLYFITEEFNTVTIQIF